MKKLVPCPTFTSIVINFAFTPETALPKVFATITSIILIKKGNLKDFLIY
jgi:hypothetical protein